eukprot:11435478-Alexandrium_andersonii.AAC.1
MPSSGCAAQPPTGVHRGACPGSARPPLERASPASTSAPPRAFLQAAARAAFARAVLLPLPPPWW